MSPPAPAPAPPPQRPTCTNTRVDTTDEAHVVFEAVARGLRPLVARRLDPDERDELVRAGAVFVWEERDPRAQATGEGMERWTDGRRWGPSRNRDGFLVYQEDVSPPGGSAAPTDELLRTRLTKRSYSANVQTPHGKRKWHLVSYFTQRALAQLAPIDADPALRALRAQIPPGKFESARGTARPRDGAPSSAHFWGLAPAAHATRPLADAPPPLAGPSSAPALALAPAPVVHTIFATATAPAPPPVGRRRGSPELPPLRYSQRIPYAPRCDADSVALRALNSVSAL